MKCECGHAMVEDVWIDSDGYGDPIWSCQYCGRHENRSTDPDPKVEVIAALEHKQWIYWSKELAKTEKISPDRLARWEKLWKTPYSELSESMKYEDRFWANKVIEAIENIKK